MITLTMLYNNVVHDNRLVTGWGMSCLIEGLEKTILFDTGGDGEILISNMKMLEKDPMKVDAVVLSHGHGDHTGGLSGFLRAGGNGELYIPGSFPEAFKKDAGKIGLQVISIEGPAEIASGVFSTGEMGADIKEQALVLNTSEGLIVITGCAHPGIVNMIKKAREVSPRRVYLALGGFHLMGDAEGKVRDTISKLKKMDIVRIAPSHCTGKKPIEIFRETWQDDFIDFGCGAGISIDSKLMMNS